MALAALFDLGFPAKALRELLAALGLSDQVSFEAVPVRRLSVGATAMHLVLADTQPLRRLPEIVALLDNSPLPDRVRERAASVFRLLAQAEGRVHRIPPEEVHFHELGALDTIVDVVGFAAGLEYLAIEAVTASPLPWFGGQVEFSHGRLPLPAPAVLELLRGAPFWPGTREEELITPTGAALLREYAVTFGPPPPFRLVAVGYGAGQREGSLLRAIMGEAAGVEDNAEAVLGEGWETIAVLESNLDDLDPRLYPPLLEGILAAGALDAYITPVQMKKGRPGVQVTVLSPLGKLGELGERLLRETTTLGVRVQQVQRRVAGRQTRRVETAYGPVRVKLAVLGGEVVGVNPEFEDCRVLAKDLGVPLKLVLAAAQVAAQGFFQPHY